MSGPVAPDLSGAGAVVEPELPVARVALDVSLQHLDRPFDYRVTADQDAAAVVGARVRVRFAGQQRDGFVLERLAASEHDGRLAPLTKVISPEPVLTPTVARLIRAVADHYAGSFADVMRLAVPPRHASTEKAVPTSDPAVPQEPAGPGPFGAYPDGPELLTALAAGRSPRAAWQVAPAATEAGGWALGFAAATAATVASGRGALLVVPDQRDLDRLAAACTQVLGPKTFAVLSADLGPSARYRAFLHARRGRVKVVIGTRAAAFAPVPDLGLVALWDDGDDLLAEPRAPYPHARDVVALRVAHEQTAAVFAGYGRSCEVQQWVERGWLRPLALPRTALRRTAPRMRVALDSDLARERDPSGGAARLPHEVFELVRQALPQGPVLVQVPRTGYLAALACQTCRERVSCPHCGGPVRVRRGSDGARAQPSCGWCGRLVTGWVCPTCGDTRWRAPVVGAGRTAEELGKAFPGTTVRRSTGDSVLREIPADPALVVATPGAEPSVAGGYAAALLLDAGQLLLRSDLRAGEEALRRWLNATALVRPGSAGGTVLAVGPSEARALQALVRTDPAAFAARELVERAEAHFPPAAKLVSVDGSAAALTELIALARLPELTEQLGPVELPPSATPSYLEGPLLRLILRAPSAQGSGLVEAVKHASATRNARKSEGALRVTVDPVQID
ncbi:MAG: primosomal protein N' [Propionibacteriaceae bacterium]